MFMMPVVGMLLSRFQARWLIIFGLLVSAGGLFLMTNFDLQIAFSDAVSARMIQSLGLAFLFVPINTVAFATVAKEKTSYATGLMNLARNIGGSTGIAVITTMLSRRSQFHQQVLVSHLTPYDSTYRATLEGLAAKLMQQGVNSVEATAKAQGMLYGMVQRQAAVLAFIDIFWVLGVTFLCMIPLILMMRRVKPHKGAAMVE